jgi:hypothetical protein
LARNQSPKLVTLAPGEAGFPNPILSFLWGMGVMTAGALAGHGVQFLELGMTGHFLHALIWIFAALFSLPVLVARARGEGGEVLTSATASVLASTFGGIAVFLTVIPAPVMIDVPLIGANISPRLVPPQARPETAFAERVELSYPIPRRGTVHVRSAIVPVLTPGQQREAAMAWVITEEERSRLPIISSYAPLPVIWSQPGRLVRRISNIPEIEAVDVVRARWGIGRRTDRVIGYWVADSADPVGDAWLLLGKFMLASAIFWFFAIMLRGREEPSLPQPSEFAARRAAVTRGQGRRR